MKYIVHHRYKGLAADCTRINIPYGTELKTIEGFICTTNGTPVCYPTSEVAKRYFAQNEDDRGLERGALTYAIAYSNRNGDNGFRFSDSEIEMLESDWAHWLRQDVDTIIFNEDFFAAQPKDLQRLANTLKIKIRR